LSISFPGNKHEGKHVFLFSAVPLWVLITAVADGISGNRYRIDQMETAVSHPLPGTPEAIILMMKREVN